MDIAPSQTTSTRYDLWLWLAAGLTALLLGLHQLSDTLQQGIYYPGDPDSLYHAHRILDAVDAPTQLAQFDPRIHAPEGSWISWPWAYDMAMAAIAHVAKYDLGVHNPLAVLAYVSPLWALFNAALVLLIARDLGLSLAVRALVMLCFAVSPLTLQLHRAGMLDHHYIEYSFVLGTLLLGLRWFARLESRRRAIALGLLLGAAPAFHNGLFIVQLPVLAALGLRWVLGRTTPLPSMQAFALSLVTSTLLFLLPSVPFRRLMFSFSLQSWFHLYVAACTAIFALEFASLRRNLASAAALLMSGTALLAIMGSQLAVGRDFLSGHLVDLNNMAEVKGPIWYVSHLGLHAVPILDLQYGGLILLLPLGILAMLLRLRRVRNDVFLFLVVMSLFGFALLLQQLRLENYGSYTLYLPLAILADDARRRWPNHASLPVAALGAVIIAAIVPAYGGMTTPLPLGSDGDYEALQFPLQQLARACAARPGIVLAESDDGHPITYHTRCPVLADNFIITAQHEHKLAEVDQFMHEPAAQVLQEAPEVRYLFLRCRTIFSSAAGGQSIGTTCRPNFPGNEGLREELLLSGPPFPPRLRLLAELKIDQPYTGEPVHVFARVFEVLPASAAAADVSQTRGP